MTDPALRQKIADLNGRVSYLDAEILAAQDAGTFVKIPPLREERQAIANQLPSLQSELAALEVRERNAHREKKLPELVSTINDAGQKLRDTLGPLSAAVADVTEAAFYQRQTARWCREALHEISDVDGVSLGPVPAVRIGNVATRFEDESKFLVTELCRILEPTFRTLEPAVADVLRNRVRAGNGLPA